MAETKLFPRVSRADTTRLKSDLASLLPSPSSVHQTAVGVEIRCHDWSGVDQIAVTAAVTNAKDRETAVADHEKGTLERDKRLRALIAWAAEKHGMTYDQARSEIDAIYDRM